jgi:hypothetical protein
MLAMIPTTRLFKIAHCLAAGRILNVTTLPDAVSLSNEAGTFYFQELGVC